MKRNVRSLTRAAWLVIAAPLFLPPARSVAMPADTTTSNEQTVRRVYEECLNGGRVERLDEMVAADYVGPQGVRGAAGFRETVLALRSGFPDIRFTVEDVVTDGDRVAVRWTWRGTHTGTFRGLAPSGKAVTDTGMAFYRLAGGKVVRAWVETDRLGVLQQIGVVPADLTARPR